MDVFEKCYQWQDIQWARTVRIYPYFSTITETTGTEVVIGGKRLIMLGSNNYLGLATDERVKAAAIEAVHEFGASVTGSRFLNGTLVLHRELERRMAQFLGKEAALVFSTGFGANLGVLGTLLGRRDHAFADRSDHASILDGIRLGAGEMKRFHHNDMASLEHRLAESDEDAGKLIVVDGIFSMEGDIADLPGIVALKQRYGARLMVDDAHGMGVLGEHGRGSAEHHGVEEDVDLVMGTFSKAFGSLGGYVAGPRDVMEHIKHTSRTMIYTASMTPASTAAALAALDIIKSEPERRQRLRRNAEKMRAGLTTLGYNIGTSQTQVIPLIIGNELQTLTFRRALLDAGLFTSPIIRGATAPGTQLIRTSCLATHTDEQLDRALEIFESVGKRHGIIGKGTIAQAAERRPRSGSIADKVLERSK